MAWFVPLIAAAISDSGNRKAAEIQSNALQNQNEFSANAASQANEIMNKQWSREMKLKEDELRMQQSRDTVKRFEDIVNSSANLRKSLINIYGGK